MYDLIAKPLQFFYGVWPNYAGAISLLTLTIMVLLLPLTLKGTRSMLAMQKLQPEMKKIQAKHRDDRQKLNEEMMKFYKENNINPVSGCLPLLLQAPVFFFLYRTVFELKNYAPFGADMGAAVARSVNKVNDGVYAQYGNFRPKHLDIGSKLYEDLSQTRQMKSFGVNLAESASQAVGGGFVKALPFVVMVLVVTATSFYQQRQIAGRNPQAAQANPQQAMLMKIMPLFFAFISFTLPAAIVVYFLVSNLFRIAQQGLITRTMYADGTGIVATTGHEIDDSSTGDDPKPKGFMAQLREMGLPDPQQAKRERSARPQSGGDSGGSTKTATRPASKKATTSGTKATSAGKGSAVSGSNKMKAASNGGSAKSVSKNGSARAAKAAKPAEAPSTDANISSTEPRRPASGPSRAAPKAANRSRNKKKRK